MTSAAEIFVSCHGCGRAFATHEVNIYGHDFPADRYCGVCQDTENAEADQKRGDTLLAQAHVPTEYLDCSFANFTPMAGNRTALRTALDWSREIRHSRKPRRGLFFSGPPGCGKTHLSIAILKEFVFGTFGSALFLNVPEWLNEMKAAFQSEGAMPTSPRGFKLVVIDDLGAERSTPWSNDQVYSLVNYRESNGLVTIASTNLGVRELEDRLGRATVSRLHKLCMEVPVEAPADLRLT